MCRLLTSRMISCVVVLICTLTISATVYAFGTTGQPSSAPFALLMRHDIDRAIASSDIAAAQASRRLMDSHPWVHPSHKIPVDFELGSFYLNRNMLQEARSIYSSLILQLIPHQQSEYRKRYLVLAYSKLGLVKSLMVRNSGDNQDAGLTELQQSERMAKGIDAIDLLPGIYNNFWSFYMIQSEYDQALAYLEKARVLLQDSADISQRASVYNHFGITYQAVDDFYHAQFNYRTALSQARLIGQTDFIARILNNLANTYTITGDHIKATRYYTEAAELLNTFSSNHAWAVAVFNLGKLASFTDRYGDAINHLNTVIPVFEETSATYLYKARILLAETHLRNQQVILANALLSDLEQLDSMHLMREDQIELELLKLKILLHQGESNRLQQGLDQFFNAHAESLSSSQHLTYLNLMIDSSTATGDSAQLNELFNDAVAVTQQFSKSLRHSEQDIYWTDLADSVYRKYIRHLLSQQDYPSSVPQVFSLLEQTRIKKYQPNRYRFDSAELTAETSRAYLDNRKRAILSETARDRERHLLDADIDKESASIAPEQVEIPTSRAFAIDQVRSQLMPHQALLYFYLSGDSSLVITVTSKHSSLSRLPRQALLSDTISKFRQTILNFEPYSSLSDPRFRQLSRSLVSEELIADEDITQLIIIPDQEINQLSFARLPMGVDQQALQYRPLVSRFQIIHAHSATDYFRQARANEQSRFSITVFADPRHDTRFNNIRTNDGNVLRLQQTGSEARAIMDLFAGHDTHLFQAESATMTNFLSSRFRESTIAHIATHSFSLPENPGLLAILASPEKDDPEQIHSLLTLDEISHHPFSSQLIVVSGCDTGIGFNVRGYGTWNYANTFIRNGAGSVITTLWPVSDRSTSKFMTRFYENLIASKGDVTRAITNTQQQMSHSGRYQHPINWAAFTYTSSKSGIQQEQITMIH